MDEFREEFKALLKESGYWNMVKNEREREEMINDACGRLEEVQRGTD